jgi:hypothetical protein
MNKKTAKLIRKHAKLLGQDSKKLKRFWLSTPKPFRNRNEIKLAIQDVYNAATLEQHIQENAMG